MNIKEEIKQFLSLFIEAAKKIQIKKIIINILPTLLLLIYILSTYIAVSYILEYKYIVISYIYIGLTSIMMLIGYCLALLNKSI